jgi:hypothetical protein
MAPNSRGFAGRLLSRRAELDGVAGAVVHRAAGAEVLGDDDEEAARFERRRRRGVHRCHRLAVVRAAGVAEVAVVGAVVAGVLGAEAAAGEPGRFIDHLYPQAYGGEVRIRSQMTACVLDERPARIYLFGEHELDHGHLCPPIAAPIIGLLL